MPRGARFGTNSGRNVYGCVGKPPPHCVWFRLTAGRHDRRDSAPTAATSAAATSAAAATAGRPGTRAIRQVRAVLDGIVMLIVDARPKAVVVPPGIVVVVDNRPPAATGTTGAEHHRADYERGDRQMPRRSAGRGWRPLGEDRHALLRVALA